MRKEYKPYELIEAFDFILSMCDELEQVLPAVESTDCFAQLRAMAEKFRNDELESFPLQEDFEDHDQYVNNLALFCGVVHSYGCEGSVTVPRNKVIDVIRTLEAFGRSNGHLMCLEYGDDDDYNEVNGEDMRSWEQYEPEELEDGVPLEYQTFELS